MGFDPINPVALVGCAGAGVGSACARELSRRADGGLILIDNDEDSLAAAADALVRPPEKVSMLTFDPADASRWRDAAEFIAGQYGRLDWAFLDAGASFPRRDNYLDAARCGLDAIMPLIGDNRDGGAIIFLTSAAALREELDQGNGFMALLRHAAREGGELQVRVSALAFGGDAPSWADTPLFKELAHGDDASAFARLAEMETPVARLPGISLGELIPLMLAEADGGAVLVVDGGHTL